MLAALAPFVALTLTLAPAAQDWKQKPYVDWNLEDTISLLNDSPWARTKDRIVMINPWRAYRVSYVIRLHSARPVKLALAKAAQFFPERNLLNVSPFDLSKAEAFIESITFGDFIVVSISVAPYRLLGSLRDTSLEDLKKVTSLSIGDTRLPLLHYLPPRQTSTREALFFFERPSSAVSKSDQLRFSTEFEGRRRVKLQHRFKFKEMDFEGRLEF